jgi:glycine/D-amino acid oxidase-like deaminating enzyme
VLRTEVAVVGGGAIGLSCARELARAGAGVTVLEAASAIGHGSSARANGGVRAQFTTAINIAFSRFSITEIETLAASDPRVGFHQEGYLLIAGTREAGDSLVEAMMLQRALGVDTGWLEPSEVMAKTPFVRPDGIVGATFHARDGFLDPGSFVGALADDARRRGTAFVTNARVDAIEPGFTLRTSAGQVRAEAIVNAAGADAKAVAALVGATVPVEPIRRNLAHVMDAGATAGGLTPMTVDVDTGVLVRREPAGGWIVAYSDPDDPPGHDTSVDPAFLPQLAERLPDRFPFLLELPIDPARCWAGLYPETPDHHAIVGEDPSVAGLFHCVGFGGHGLMHAPAAGRAIAELITGGRCDAFDLHPLLPSRFDEGDLVTETAVL